jgi:NitT/TauT family transport system substrate-binding protein
VNDSYLKSAFAASGLNYSDQLARIANYEVAGTDDYCHRPITAPREAGEIWLNNGGVRPYSSAACTLAAYEAFVSKREPVDEAYVFDHIRGIKLFAKDAYFAVSSHTSVVPFMLKQDAVAYAAKSGAKVMSFTEALKSVGTGS